MKQSKTPQHIGRMIIVLLWLSVICAAMIPIFIFYKMISFEIHAQYRQTIGDPSVDFTQITELEWPKHAKVKTVADTHGGFLGDGEFYLIFDTDQKTLDVWLSNPPPWQAEEWARGSVPPDIGRNASFGGDGLAMSQTDGNAYHYSGNGELADLLKSNEIWYVARERCCSPDGFYFHNGDLLIINAETQQVWLSSWDF